MPTVELDIKLDTKQKEQVLRAVNNVEAQVKREIIAPGELMKDLARDYMLSVKIAIMTGKFNSSYKDYIPPYKKWKREIFGSNKGFWQLKGDLLKALTVRVEQDYVFAGIPDDIVDSGGKNWSKKGSPKKIAMYGTMMEEGRYWPINKEGRHPKRPLFEPLFRDFTFSKSVKTQGGMWIISEKSLVRIGEFWR